MPNHIFIVDTKDDGGWGHASPFATAEAIHEVFLGVGETEGENASIRDAIQAAERHPGQEFPAPGGWDEAWLSVSYLPIAEDEESALQAKIFAGADVVDALVKLYELHEGDEASIGEQMHAIEAAARVRYAKENPDA